MNSSLRVAALERVLVRELPLRVVRVRRLAHRRRRIPCRGGTPSSAPACRARRAPRTNPHPAPARTARSRDASLPFDRWRRQTNRHGRKIVHYEIAAADADRAQAFWGGLFGWEFQGSGMPEIDYRMAQITESAGAAIYPGPDKVGYPIVYHDDRRHRCVDREGERARRQRRGQDAGADSRLVRRMQGHGGELVLPLAGRFVRRAVAPGGRIRFCEGRAVSGSGLATTLAVAAGLAGSVQIALMSRLGDRIGVFQALGFATLVTAVARLRARARDSPQRRRLRAGAPPAVVDADGRRDGPADRLHGHVRRPANRRRGDGRDPDRRTAVMGAAIDRFGLFGSEQDRAPLAARARLRLLAVGAVSVPAK